MLCFVLIDSVLLNLLCVWILSTLGDLNYRKGKVRERERERERQTETETDRERTNERTIFFLLTRVKE